MDTPTEATVLASEEQLRHAMLESDVDRLDALLSEGLLFTSHIGTVTGKKEDLEAHRSGFARIDSLELSEMRLVLLPATALVSVRAAIRGTFGGTPASGIFRFTRVWASNEAGHLQVVMAHSTQVLEP